MQILFIINSLFPKRCPVDILSLITGDYIGIILAAATVYLDMMTRPIYL
jgi:hypothetical protein